MKTVVQAAFLAALAVSSLSTSHAQPAEPGTTAADTMSAGEIKKVDKAAGKITIKHGPLSNIGMDAMTMVFRVKDPSMLDQVKAGDHIRFIAEQPNGQLTVTQMEKQQ
ncbi:copper-binding protein [Noviherbaspirillum sp. L7-7A]|uniref:copper-binding protein n=1 Tax=Noviherbaspirillum sp. L7-7A TaxID=2850560 RepID=UPI001C2B93F9|nr:copper-binding protein [Noviherbaspirillum sp. L7-7A]MBV0881397.1 copper-binding protein [Noviherbaspirillum sp. L7-7A]